MSAMCNNSMIRYIALAVMAMRFGSAAADTNLSFAISNHDQSPSHRVVHAIVGQTNYVYDAHGSLETIHGEAIAFLIKDSANVTIRNLRLDWERPCMTEARIAGFVDGTTIVTIDYSRFPCVVENGKLLMTGPGWTNGVALAKLFDGRTHEHVADTGDISFRGEAIELGDGKVALMHDFSRYGAGMKCGDVIVLRPGRRPCPAIVATDSRDVKLEDVVVHDAYGMAFIAQRCENVVWRGSDSPEARTSGVFPRDGCFVSAHADASHFSNVKGRVLVENCLFEGMMDDAINVHSTCMVITGIDNGRFIRCRYGHPQTVGLDLFRPGETLRFIKGATLENGPEARIAAVMKQSREETTLVLESMAPPEYGVGDAVENADFQCEAVFRGNVVRCNRARGALFTTPKPVQVESNRFESVTGAAVLFAGDCSKWFETGACKDVLIRGNVFSNCCTAARWHGYSGGVLSFFPSICDIENQQTWYHGNVIIEGNDFISFDVPLLCAISTENIVWRRNRRSYHCDYEGWEQPPFVFRHCRNVEIDGEKAGADAASPLAKRIEVDFSGGWTPCDVVGGIVKRFALPTDAEGQCVFLDVQDDVGRSGMRLNGVCISGKTDGTSSYRVNLTAAIYGPGRENVLEVYSFELADNDRRRHIELLRRTLKLVRTAPVHVGFKGVLVSGCSVLPDGSRKIHADVDVKGSLLAAAGFFGVADGSGIEVRNRVLGEDSLVIRKSSLNNSETHGSYILETTLMHGGSEVDKVFTPISPETCSYALSETSTDLNTRGVRKR